MSGGPTAGTPSPDRRGPVAAVITLATFVAVAAWFERHPGPPLAEFRLQLTSDHPAPGVNTGELRERLASELQYTETFRLDSASAIRATVTRRGAAEALDVYAWMIDETGGGATSLIEISLGNTDASARGHLSRVPPGTYRMRLEARTSSRGVAQSAAVLTIHRARSRVPVVVAFALLALPLVVWLYRNRRAG